MPHDGKNATAGLDAAERLLANDPAAGTIVFMSDGFDSNQADAFVQKAKTIASSTAVARGRHGERRRRFAVPTARSRWTRKAIR